MNSFYGGKQGASFIIKKSFDTYASMVEAFELGPDYTEVLYDEYVIIATGDEKGSVYRRGYDINNEGGAEFICNLAGPAGGLAPMIIDNYKNIEELGLGKWTEEGPFKNVVGTGQLTVNEGDLIPGAVFETGTDDEGNSIETVKYNNAIDWIIANIEEAGSQHVKAGFKIPYPVFKFDLALVEGGVSTELQRLSDSSSFYHHYKLTMPKPTDEILHSIVLTKTDVENNTTNYTDALAALPSTGIILVYEG